MYLAAGIRVMPASNSYKSAMYKCMQQLVMWHGYGFVPSVKGPNTYRLKIKQKEKKDKV